MTETRSITCDSCGEECVTHSSMPANYTLELKQINTNVNTTGTVHAVQISPWLDTPKHFCSKRCLINWLNNT